MRPKVGLALGSGGLRGLAHIGVLKVLEQEKITIDYIAGCSIGSMIGAMYCSGHTPDTMHKLAKHLKRRFWLDFVVPKMGIIAGDKLLDTIKLLTKQKSFTDLTIPLAIVATDIQTGREVVFKEGDLAKAVRASVSVPGIFIPYEMDDMVLVDGAVLNPTPIDIVQNMGADIVIAVDLIPASAVLNARNMFDVIIQSINIMERELSKHRQHHCDVMISPEVAHISPSSFETVDECVSLGEKAALEALPNIKQLLSNHECRPVNVENPIRLAAIEG